MTGSPTSISPAREGAWWLRVVLVGGLAGFTSGLFGVGGGIVIVPALVMLAGFPHKLATGTSLTAIIPISLAGTVGYGTGGEVDWVAAAYVSVGALAGSIVGTRLLVRIRTPWLQVTFALVMVAAALRLLVGDAEGGGRPDLTVTMVAAMVLLGVVSGIVAGLLGVGGGIVMVPALTIIFGVPHVLSKGTSLAVIVPTAIMATVRNRRTGLTALKPGLAAGLGGVVSAWLASRVALGLDPDVAQGLFGLFLVATALRLGRQGLRGMREPLAGTGAP